MLNLLRFLANGRAFLILQKTGEKEKYAGKGKVLQQDALARGQNRV